MKLFAATHHPGYLAHKNTPNPPRTPLGPQAEACGRVLGGGGFLWARYPCRAQIPTRCAAWLCERRDVFQGSSLIKKHPPPLGPYPLNGKGVIFDPQQVVGPYKWPTVGAYSPTRHVNGFRRPLLGYSRPTVLVFNKGLSLSLSFLTRSLPLPLAKTPNSPTPPPPSLSFRGTSLIRKSSAVGQLSMRSRRATWGRESRVGLQIHRGHRECSHEVRSIPAGSRSDGTESGRLVIS